MPSRPVQSDIVSELATTEVPVAMYEPSAPRQRSPIVWSETAPKRLILLRQCLGATGPEEGPQFALNKQAKWQQPGIGLTAERSVPDRVGLRWVVRRALRGGTRVTLSWDVAISGHQSWLRVPKWPTLGVDTNLNFFKKRALQVNCSTGSQIAGVSRQGSNSPKARQ